MNLEEIKIYLPKYLSDTSKNALLDSIKEFPVVRPDRFYTSKLQDSQIVYQGDGLTGFIFLQLPHIETKLGNALILSNTCDIAQENVRLFESRIVYAPIIGLEKYQSILLQEGVKDSQVTGHVQSIRSQHVTQIFYLPELPNVFGESIVFFDRVLNIRATYVESADLKYRRLFSLSDFGHYLLLFKLSFHFCRLQDKVDRGSDPLEFS